MSSATHSPFPSVTTLADLARRCPLQAVSAGHVIRDQANADAAWFIAKGTAAAERISRDGRRHIAAIFLPGDAAGLSCAMLGRADATIRAVSDVEAHVVSADDLRRLVADQPALGGELWRLTLGEAAIARTWAANLALQEARNNLAHLVCELGIRFERAGMGTRRCFHHPFTQEHLADMLGLTAIHTNRVIQGLRAEGLLVYHRKQIEIAHWEELARIAEFDPAYLG